MSFIVIIVISIHIYLVGGLEHFVFFHILGMSSSQLTNIFQRGWNNQPFIYIYMIYICDVEYNRWCGYIISSSPSPLHSWCQLLSWRSFGTLPLASWGQSDGDVQGRQGVCFWGIWECLNWLVVSNMFYFPFHIWDIILPINIFQDGYCTTNQ